MASKDKISNCEKCSNVLTEAYMLPCMHNFCSTCIIIIKDDQNIICSLCLTSHHNQKIKRNLFLEKLSTIKINDAEQQDCKCELCDPDNEIDLADKYCIECCQKMCNRCASSHIRTKSISNHIIFNIKELENINLKVSEPICITHQLSLSVYCQSCNSIICPTCGLMNHQGHIFVDNLKEINMSSKEKIQNNINFLVKKNEKNKKILSKNKKITESFSIDIELISKQIKDHAEEIKQYIDNMADKLVKELSEIKDCYFNDLQKYTNNINKQIKQISQIIKSLKETSNHGSNVDIFNANKNYEGKDFSKNAIPKLLVINYKKAFDLFSSNIGSIEQNQYDISSHLIPFDKHELEHTTTSVCLIKNNLYSIIYSDCCLRIYQVEPMKHLKYLKKINLNYLIKKINTPNDMREIIGVYKELIINVLIFENSKQMSVLYKFQPSDESFVEIKTLPSCFLSSTNQQTLLATTSKCQLIELTTNGDEIKKIDVSVEVIEKLLFCFTTAHQLNDGSYIVMSHNKKTMFINLLNAEGKYLKSITTQMNPFKTKVATDGDKYIFMLNTWTGKLIILTTKLLLVKKSVYFGTTMITYNKKLQILELLSSKKITLKKINAFAL